MEYNLIQEANKRYKIFYALIAGLFALTIISFFYLGFLGLIASFAILTSIAILPLVYNKYRFFLVLWLFIVPFFDNFRQIIVAGTTPIVFLATGLTIPFGLILIFREKGQIFKDLPFLKYLIVFQIIIFLNFFRQGTEFSSIVEILKIFVQIFVIFCTYLYIKQNKTPEKLYFWINLFVVTNCTAAFFQMITGIGLRLIEGVPRVNGFLGHPNVLGFLLNLYLPFAIYKYLYTKKQKEKNIWLGLIAVSVLTLFFTMTKVALFTFAVMLMILFFQLPYKLKFRILITSLIGIVAFLAVNYLFSLNIIENLIERLNNTSSYEWRLKIWSYLISDINFSNIWLGHGINSEKHFLNMINYGEAVAAHNGYIQLIFEFGISSIFFYLSFLNSLVYFTKKMFFTKCQCYECRKDIN